MKQVRITLILVLLALVGCAHVAEKPWSERTPKEKAIWMDGIYNVQYDEYQVRAARADLLEDERKVMRVKKQIFIEIWPLLKSYSKYAEAGVVSPVELEMHIINLLNRLIYGGLYGHNSNNRNRQAIDSTWYSSRAYLGHDTRAD